MSHPIVHIEMTAQDRAELGRFYQEVFGWQLQDYPDMDYTTFDSGEDSVGGGFMAPSDEMPAGTVVFYISTDDINASLQQIRESGGDAFAEPRDIPGIGSFAHFRDPSGNLVALLQPAEGSM